MPATKRSKEIGEAKAALREQILSLTTEAQQSVKRVPDFVLKGSCGHAVAWKALAEKYVEPECPAGPKAATLAELPALLEATRAEVDQLCGRKPLVIPEFA